MSHYDVGGSDSDSDSDSDSGDRFANPYMLGASAGGGSSGGTLGEYGDQDEGGYADSGNVPSFSSSSGPSTGSAVRVENLRRTIAELEGPRREVGPQTVQVRPVCGRTGGGPQRLVARRPRFVSYELGAGYQGENVVTMWHTVLNQDWHGRNKRFMWATLNEQPDVTMAVRYLRGPESLGEVPEEERDLYDRERYKVEVRPDQPDPRASPLESQGPNAKRCALLFYRGEPMDTSAGEKGEYMFVMSAEGDIYAADGYGENVVEGPGVYLRQLDDAAEALLAEGWNFRAATRVPPTDPERPAPAEPATCGLRALDRKRSCARRVNGPDEARFVLGVTTRDGSPTGFEPVDGQAGVAYFADLPEGGAWVCNACFDRRGRERCKVRWPVIVRPNVDLPEIRAWIDQRWTRKAQYPCALDAIDERKPEYRRAAVELRSAAAQRVGGTPRKMLLLHHSSFLAGGPVACAGSLKVEKGVILEINNNSGHYSPPRPLLIQVVARLAELGVDVRPLKVYYLKDKEQVLVNVAADWPAFRAALGSVHDPEDMERKYLGPGVDIRADFRDLLRETTRRMRRSGRLYARSPDAAPAPCATSGCAGDGTCVAIDEVGETFLCQTCLDVRLLGRCERPGCQEPSTHEVLATDLEGEWERGDRPRNRDEKGKLTEEVGDDVEVRVGLCAQHFRERLTIHCAEPGCGRTSEQGVMDAVGKGLYCKEHFEVSMTMLGLRVCQDPDCTETRELAQVGDRWLCRDHQQN